MLSILYHIERLHLFAKIAHKWSLSFTEGSHIYIDLKPTPLFHVNSSFFKAIYFTITRVLKCNQLFAGGIDYPVIKLNKLQNVNFEKIKIIYWYVPAKNNKYFVVKNREWKEKNEQYESK